MTDYINLPPPSLSLREVARYLGCRDQTVLEGPLYEECKELFTSVSAPRAIYQQLSVCQTEHGVDFGAFAIASHDLAKALSGCTKAVVFAVTLGTPLDRLLLRYGKISPAHAVVLQAMGAAAVEDACDTLCDHLYLRYGTLTPRFSCGYGDAPLAAQKDILRHLHAEKILGITLTDALLMLPSKSVTAFCGIKTPLDEDTNG